jgi:DNA (cytosine-5)-methyltransferase 1
MEKLKLLDLFSGIGGFSLGLERSGAFETVAFCEIEPFCRKVLKKHWPEVPQYGDIRGLSASQLELDGIRVDAICGGFPCQDISFAGKGAGLAGERSGLWFEFARLIGEIRPRYVIVENVSALLVRGLDVVLGTLAEIGYDAEWHCIPAYHVGAHHERDRVWIVAYPTARGSIEAGKDSKRPKKRSGGSGSILANAASSKARSAKPGQCDCTSQEEWPFFVPSLGGRDSLVGAGDWNTEPSVRRVADGVSANVDRVSALGNAVVPQIPELIGRAILEYELSLKPA